MRAGVAGAWCVFVFACSGGRIAGADEDAPRESPPSTSLSPAGAAGSRAAPAASAESDRTPPARRGLLVMPLFGVQSHQGSLATNVGPGLRAGALIGERLNSHWSINGELLIDGLNNTNDNQPFEEAQVDLAPLFHYAADSLEVVVGPKVGYGRGWYSYPAYAASASSSGVILGVNAGLFGLLRESASLGGVASIDYYDVTTCSISLVGFTCVPRTAKIVSFAAAALF